MAINNPYVPGDPYSYDLKWLVAQIKKHSLEIDSLFAQTSLAGEYINFKYPGRGLEGVVGDGVTDDTNAFKTLVSYCELEHHPIYIPENISIRLTENVTITGIHNIISQGKITGDPSLTINVRISARNTIPATWDFTNVEGMCLKLQGVKNGLVRIQSANNVLLYAEGQTDYYSMAYSTYILGTIGQLTIQGDNVGIGGWINTNVFLGGRITTGITFPDGLYPHNHNTFYGTMFEGGASLDMQVGSNNSFFDTRGEGAITYSFAQKCFANLVTTHYTASQPMTRNPLTQSNVTDLNGSNQVRPAGEEFMDRYETTLSRLAGGYDKADVIKYGDGLWAYYSAGRVLETDFISIDKPVWTALIGGNSKFRLVVELFDDTKTKITTQPSVPPSYAGSLSWDSVAEVYRSGAASYYGIGWMRYNVSGDSGVAYIKARIITAAGGEFDTVTGMIGVEKGRDPVSFHYSHERIVGSSAPTAGDWELGDVIYNTSPTAGGDIGWVCTAAGTPGTWKTFGAISS